MSLRDRPRAWPTARYGETATVLNGGKILLVGGKGPAGPLASAELYDPATNAITAAGRPAVGHANGTATLLANGKVLVVGGEATDTPFTGVAELYDPALAPGLAPANTPGVPSFPASQGNAAANADAADEKSCLPGLEAPTAHSMP